MNGDQMVTILSNIKYSCYCYFRLITELLPADTRLQKANPSGTAGHTKLISQGKW